jgi:hypothetical protein
MTTVLIAVSVALGVAAGLLIAGLGQSATAQQGLLGGGASGESGGIFAVTGPLTDRSYGLYVIDSRRQSVAVYEYVANDRGGKVLQLRAARNFGYDTRLSEYNTSPSPAEIAELVGQDRSPLPQR